MKTILLIDDNEDFRVISSSVLLDAGYDVWDVPTPADAFPVLKAEKFDLIICDLHMPFCSGPQSSEYVQSFEVGVRTIKELRDVYPSVPIVALSSAASHDLKRISKYLDPVPAFSKPLRTGDMISIVENMLYIEAPATVQ